MDYKKAGVDIQAGDALVDWLKTQSSGLHSDRLIEGIGGFASLFRADFPEMKEPCLVSCTDGVGTKVIWAAELGRYREVAQDLVAMCVNDLICVGASPLFFLDYYASGQLQLEAAKDFLTGVRLACESANCLLIGGETAEMPGVYHGRDFDCAGFAVGIVDRPKTLGSHRVRVGDRLIGVSSSGFHSNGFSLLRKVFSDDYRERADELMRPTSLYVKLADQLKRVDGLSALAHITGGGLNNIPRVLPKGTRARLKHWPVPDLFKEVQLKTGMSWPDIFTTLNCGVGLVIVSRPHSYSAICQTVKDQGFGFYDLGEVGSSDDEAPTWEFEE